LQKLEVIKAALVRKTISAAPLAMSATGAVETRMRADL
jgi:hypothetical protein